MAEKMGLYQFGPDGLSQQVIDENRGSFTFGPGRDQPARPGQRLLHAGRRRHAVRRQPGDGGPRPARAAADRLVGRAAGHRRPLHARRRSRPASRTRSTRCSARTSSPATAARPPPGRTCRDTRSPARPGRRRRTSPWPSSATRPRSPRASWCSTRRSRRTSAASAAVRARPSGTTRWRRSSQARGSGVFPPADPVVVVGNTRPVPGCSTVSQCRSVLSAAGFQTALVRVDSDKKAGDLEGTSPPRAGAPFPASSCRSW